MKTIKEYEKALRYLNTCIIVAQEDIDDAKLRKEDYEGRRDGVRKKIKKLEDK